MDRLDGWIIVNFLNIPHTHLFWYLCGSGTFEALGFGWEDQRGVCGGLKCLLIGWLVGWLVGRSVGRLVVQ